MNQQPLRSTDVRDRNQKLVLRLLFQLGPLSQSGIVQKTGLKAPTVFRIFAKLEEERYIEPCDEPDSARDPEGDRKGRRPAYFSVVPDAVFAIGVDFSTFGASVIVVNFVNEVIHHAAESFTPGVDSEQVLARIAAMIQSALSRCGIPAERLAGIGIGAPGSVNTVNGTVVDYDRISGLRGFSLRDHFQDMFGVPVYVHNNASVIAASEYHYDSAVEFDRVLAVLVRGGVGAAFINHGEIFVTGATTALELGRTRVCRSAGDGARDDTARADQSLESIAGEGPLLKQIQATEAVADWDEVETRLTRARISELLRSPSRTLATAVRNLYHILHPDAVLIISRYGVLADVLTGAVAERIPEITSIPITYDPVKACYGATDLVFQHFFSDRGVA